MRLDPPVSQEAEYGRGQKGNPESQQEPYVGMIPHGALDAVGPCGGRLVYRGCTQGLLLLPCAGQQPADFLAFKDDHGQNCTQLDGDFRVGSDVTGEAEGMAYQNKMSRGRDGEKLCESFDDPQYHGEHWAPFVHAYPTSNSK